jgi:deoxyhypusine synthase
MNLERKGHDYFIQITADVPHYGGLSGATPSEAISWKKMKPNSNDVVIYCDCTIGAPLLFYYILSKKYKRKLRRLYLERENYLNRLKAAYENKVLI